MAGYRRSTGSDRTTDGRAADFPEHALQHIQVPLIQKDMEANGSSCHGRELPVIILTGHCRSEDGCCRRKGYCQTQQHCSFHSRNHRAENERIGGFEFDLQGHFRPFC